MFEFRGLTDTSAREITSPHWSSPGEVRSGNFPRLQEAQAGWIEAVTSQPLVTTFAVIFCH